MRYPYDIRIIAGKHRGRRVAIPELKDIRPTANRSRQAVFNMLTHARNGFSAIIGARVLDLYTGTGALGLEALSRGAEHVTFVDTKTDLARQNVEAMGEQDQATIITADATQLPKADEPYDIIFMDPPYNQNLIQKTIDMLVKNGYIDERAILVIESSMEEEYELPGHMRQFDERVYGMSRFAFSSPVVQAERRTRTKVA